MYMFHGSGCVFVIAPLRSVTVRYVLRELSIFLLCFDYAIEWLGNSSALLWPGAATSPSAVSKYCGILGNGLTRPKSTPRFPSVLSLYSLTTFSVVPQYNLRDPLQIFSLQRCRLR